MSERWTAEQIPDLTGRTAVVTGGNSGIGFEAALELAKHGARTILACRDINKAGEAAERIRAARADAAVEGMALDLASLASVRAFAQALAERAPKLDLLVNNAGVMALPRTETADGFEMQIGTNHLGHFALTGLVLPRLIASGDARVVTVSSGVHPMGKIHLDDLHLKKKYQRWFAYAQSKLANLLFMAELDRRLRAAGLPIKSVGCHPGYANTNLQGVAARSQNSRFGERFWRWMNNAFAQSAAKGALPTLYAAVAPDIEGGEYIGPHGIGAARGYPVKQRPAARARDAEMAAKLWALSEELTGVRYEGLGAGATISEAISTDSNVSPSTSS